MYGLPSVISADLGDDHVVQVEADFISDEAAKPFKPSDYLRPRRAPGKPRMPAEDYKLEAKPFRPSDYLHGGRRKQRR